MAEATSLPTAQELTQLAEAFRRDPASDAFVHLGECLIDLGRPGDAVEVGARGLQANPGSMAGRLMVARAFMSLHQWKQAQAELLKVVKADRNSAGAFRLLGEVLLRRSDYERALPVLQHAQNLTPADPDVLSLLRRARAGEPLDPPPPIPTPRQPDQQGGGGDLSPPVPNARAGELASDGGAPDQAIGRVGLERREIVKPRGPAVVSERVDAAQARDARAQEIRAFAPVQHYSPPQAEDPLRPLDSPEASAAPVRPRVLPAEKPKDAAQKSLRESAAVGEHHLGELLGSGLLNVPSVRSSAASHPVPARKKWGRSSRRYLIYLSALLVVGLGGGAFWYWYAGQQKARDVERHLAAATAKLDTGSYGDLAAASVEARAALQRDPGDPYIEAVLAEIGGLNALLHGEPSGPNEVAPWIESATAEISRPADPGYRELVIARAASALSTLGELEADAAAARLQEVEASLRAWLETSPDDGLARWLLGRCRRAAGDRSGALEAFQQADASGKGPVIAAVDLADHHLDEGEFETAMGIYDRALERSPEHPLAFVGRSLARSERRVGIAEAMADLNVGLGQVKGPRLEAWKQLALAFAKLVLEDYEEFDAALDGATGVSEPRFAARVGLGRIRQGRIVEAARVRSEVRWLGPDPSPHPLVVLLDAELLLARGLPAEAIEAVAERDGLRALSLRGRALYDLGQVDEALASFEQALAIAPETVELQVWAEASRMRARSGEERRQADETLDSLGRQAVAKTARYVHGVALMHTGKPEQARDKLEMSLDGVTPEYPNPLAYRAHVTVAELDFSEGKPEAAVAQLEKAFALNPGFLPARDLMGRILATTDPAAAREHLLDVVEAGVATAGAELALVTVLMPSDRLADREAAMAAIERAQAKGADLEEVQAAIEAVDPALFDELGVSEPR